MKALYGILLLVLAACGGKRAGIAKQEPVLRQVRPITIRSDDSLLVRTNGLFFYKDSLFSGTITTCDENARLRSTQSFYAGKEEGFLRSYYANGNRDAERFYHAGEKDGISKGWWPNGRLRFEYHFRMGDYEGDFKEWYASGKPMKHIYYHLGKEQWGRGWRENGKPYMSFAVKDGRLYGSINPNLCYSLKKEKGVYIAVRK